MKIETWKGEDLENLWEISYKLDGVRAHRVNNQWQSRTGKPLYNLPDMPTGIYEVFITDFETTVSAVRTRTGQTIDKEALYEIEPELDSRIFLGSFPNPSKEQINKLFLKARALGYEGLVLKQGSTRLKVKPKETYDLKILGFIEGRGKHKDSLGALITEWGKVGTGFTNEQRAELFNKQELYLGKHVEIECMGLTKDFKLRHPRFLRFRWDKDV